MRNSALREINKINDLNECWLWNPALLMVFQYLLQIFNWTEFLPQNASILPQQFFKTPRSRNLELLRPVGSPFRSVPASLFDLIPIAKIPNQIPTQYPLGSISRKWFHFSLFSFRSIYPYRLEWNRVWKGRIWYGSLRNATFFKCKSPLVIAEQLSPKDRHLSVGCSSAESEPKFDAIRIDPLWT